MEIWNLVFIQDQVDAELRGHRPAPGEERRHRLVARARRDAPPGCRERLRDGPPPPHPRGGRVDVGEDPRRRSHRRCLAEGDRRARPRHDVPDRRRRAALQRGPGLRLAHDAPSRGVARTTPGHRALRDGLRSSTWSSSRFGDAYPELRENEAFVRQVAGSEEERFAATLRQGLVLFEEAKSRAEQGRVTGDDAFKLSDTFGFPLQLTEELAAEAGLTVDSDRFGELLEEQRSRARAAAKKVPIGLDAGAGPAVGRSSAMSTSSPTAPSSRCSIPSSASCPRRRRARRSGCSSTGPRSTPRAEARSVTEGSIRTPTGVIRVTDTVPAGDRSIVHIGVVESGEVRAGRGGARRGGRGSPRGDRPRPHLHPRRARDAPRAAR